MAPEVLFLVGSAGAMVSAVLTLRVLKAMAWHGRIRRIRREYDPPMRRLQWSEFSEELVADRPHHKLAYHALLEAETEGRAHFRSEGVYYLPSEGSWLIWERGRLSH